MSAVSSWIGKMEDAVFAEDFTDSIHGYRAYIDGQSLVGWYVASEITGNLDALLSIYMYRNADQRLCFGPLWDMDFAYDRSGAGRQTKVAWPGQQMPVQYFTAGDPWSLSYGRVLDTSMIRVKGTSRSV